MVRCFFLILHVVDTVFLGCLQGFMLSGPMPLLAYQTVIIIIIIMIMIMITIIMIIIIMIIII